MYKYNPALFHLFCEKNSKADYKSLGFNWLIISSLSSEPMNYLKETYIYGLHLPYLRFDNETYYNVPKNSLAF